MAVASDVKRNGNSGGVNKHKTIFAVACVIVLIALITLVVMKGGGKVGHAIYIGQDVVTVTDGKFAPEVELKEGEKLESFLIKVKADVFDICTKVDLNKIMTVYGSKGLTKIECADKVLVIGSAFNDPNTKAYGKGTYSLVGLQFINPGVDSAKLTFERFEVKDNGEKILSAPPGKVVTLNFNVDPNADTDKDSVLDTKDNCPTNYNKDQKDIDKDKIGDICDNEPCGANTLWSNNACKCDADWLEQTAGDIAVNKGCLQKGKSMCTADDTLCGVFCQTKIDVALAKKVCNNGVFNADLNGDGFVDDGDIIIIQLANRAIESGYSTCGSDKISPVQDACPFSGLYVCENLKNSIKSTFKCDEVAPK